MPRSAVSGLGCRNGGNAAVMQESPSRTVPRSAVSGLGCRNGGKAAVMQAVAEPHRAAVGGLGFGLPQRRKASPHQSGVQSFGRVHLVVSSIAVRARLLPFNEADIRRERKKEA